MFGLLLEQFIYSYKRDKYENEEKEKYKDWLIEGELVDYTVSPYIYLYIYEEYFQVAISVLGGTNMLPLEKVDAY